LRSLLVCSVADEARFQTGSCRSITTLCFQTIASVPVRVGVRASLDGVITVQMRFARFTRPLPAALVGSVIFVLVVTAAWFQEPEQPTTSRQEPISLHQPTSSTGQQQIKWVTSASGKVANTSTAEHGTGIKRETAALPLLPGTYLYLAIAARNPAPWTLARSCLPNSMAIVMTYAALATAQPKHGCMYKPVFFPGSTWTTGRNELLRLGKQVEIEQNWKFEFVIFLDDDAKLVLTSNRGVSGETRFRELLLRDRPMRSSILFGFVPLHREHGLQTCARACFSDGVVDAYHRTAVDVFLPYNPALDKTSCYMSAYMNILMVSALAPQHCHIYREVSSDYGTVMKSKYPKGNDKGIDKGPEWSQARDIVAKRLTASRIPGHETTMNETVLNSKLQQALYGDESEKCTTLKAGVDYSKFIPTVVK